MVLAKEAHEKIKQAALQAFINNSTYIIKSGIIKEAASG
jgi:hypothetical protein